jgi:hypothetical protein
VSYKVVKSETALGTQFSFQGPGLSRYANGVHFLQVPNEWALQCFNKDRSKEQQIEDREAETIVRLLAEAFEAGKKEAKREFREVLGIHKHWGSRDED